jgi:signal transduction histidine kinase
MEDEDLKHIYDISLFNISDLDVLLHEILKQTRELLKAEAGTIYIKEEDSLLFKVFQNDALAYEDIYKHYHSTLNLKLPLSQRKKYLAVDSILSKKVILVDDVYNSKAYDFEGTKEFDKKFKYKTNSIITIPLIHPIDEKVLGVVQLLNKKIDDKYQAFNKNDKDTLSMFASFISLSISKELDNVKKLKRLNKELEDTNKNLEKRVNEEVQANKSSSAIIYHQSKMASMGEMMANIAHQWRQPLSTISVIASALSMDIELDSIRKDVGKDYLQKIVDTTQELSNTIEEFKSFYDIDTINENINISEVINKCLEVSESLITSNQIEIVLNLDESIEIYGLKNEFTQAILNVISNSKDALIENIPMHDGRYIFIDLYKENQKNILKIKDNALGIKEHNIEKIFIENFSTKNADTFNGIGLYLTRLIVEKHLKGSISCENSSFTYKDKDCKGALFTIILDS